MGTSFVHTRRKLQGDSANCNDGFTRKFAGFANKIQADYGIEPLLCRRGKDRADSDVIGGSQIRGANLLEIVSGNPDPDFGTDDSAGIIGRQILMADVDTSRANKGGNVRAVINDETRTTLGETGGQSCASIEVVSR